MHVMRLRVRRVLQGAPVFRGHRPSPSVYNRAAPQRIPRSFRRLLVSSRIGTLALALVCLGLGAVAQRIYDVRTLRSEGTGADEGSRASTDQPPGPIWTPVEIDRSHVDYTRQPLWAWGAADPPKPGEKQAVQF